MVTIKSFRSVILPVLALLIQPLTPRDAGAQAPPPLDERFLDRGQNWINQDYYDPSNRNLLENVEKNHLQKIREELTGVLQYREGDMRYTLWVFPNHPKALFILGAIAQANSNPTLPIPYYERALQLFPQHAYTHAQYGAYLVQIGALAVGIQQLEEALRLNPYLEAAKAWLGEAYQKRSASAPAPSPASPN